MLSDSNICYIQGQNGLWEIVIGLEVHAQVTSERKLFSNSGTNFNAPPNANVDLLDIALPGVLPVVNMDCVYQAVRTGLALNATIHAVSLFDRKNYFYPDLPSGYQITQFFHPIVTNGFVMIDVPHPNEAQRTYEKKVEIERLHLEQDAGKTIHDQHPTLSLLDFNRSGIALMEIVTRPDIRSADEAKAYVKQLQLILRTIDTCDGNMEEGSLRVDVNLSMRRAGSTEMGTRCEIKNLNSFKAMEAAIEFEAHRQIELLEQGKTVVQETRLFDTKDGETKSMRLKENALDYRYMPDPDLRSVVLDPEVIRMLKANMPELPHVKKRRLMREYNVSPYEAGLLISDIHTSVYFEQVVKAGVDSKLAVSWVIGELFALLNKEHVPIQESPVGAKALGELLILLQQDSISGPTAKAVFKRAYQDRTSPIAIVQQENLFQISDVAAISAILDQVIAENPNMVAQVQKKANTLQWFFGQVMKKSDGKAKPQIIHDLLAKRFPIEGNQ